MNTPQPAHMYQAGTSGGMNGLTARATIMCRMYATSALVPNVRKTPH